MASWLAMVLLVCSALAFDDGAPTWAWLLLMAASGVLHAVAHLPTSSDTRPSSEGAER